MTINETQDTIIEDFTYLDDWMDRYALLIDLGKSLNVFPDSERTDKNLIDGCQSKVWMVAKMKNGKMIIEGDGDAILVKGIVALLLQVLSGHSPQEVIEADLYFIEKIGLLEHLSPTRTNGLVAMIKQIRLYASTFKAQEEKDSNEIREE